MFLKYFDHSHRLSEGIVPQVSLEYSGKIKTIMIISSMVGHIYDFLVDS